MKYLPFEVPMSNVVLLPTKHTPYSNKVTQNISFNVSVYLILCCVHILVIYDFKYQEKPGRFKTVTQFPLEWSV